MSYRSIRSRNKGDEPSKIVLPITPMLDMTFQLLFFFIINFKPMPAEGVLDTALPSAAMTQALKDKPPDKKDQVDKADDFKADVTVKVRADEKGEISDLALVNDVGKDEVVGTTLDSLVAKLKEKRKDLTAAAKVKIQPETGALKVRNLIAVRDACGKGGFTDISFVMPADYGK